MESLSIILWGLAAGVAVVAGVNGWQVLEARRADRRLGRLAQRFGGWLVAGKGRHRGHVRLEIEETAAAVFTEGDREGSGRTWFHADWVPPGTLRLVPTTWFDRVKALFGRGDIQVGDPEFDSRHFVHGSSEDWVRAALDAPMRKHVSLLEAVFGPVRLDASPAGVRIECARDLVGDAAAFELAVETCCAIVRRLRTIAAGRGALLAAAELAAKGQCPVCAERIESDPRICPRCVTPHHLECWNYFGGCALFGCDPREARPLPGGKNVAAKG